MLISITIQLNNGSETFNKFAGSIAAIKFIEDISEQETQDEAQQDLQEELSKEHEEDL